MFSFIGVNHVDVDLSVLPFISRQMTRNSCWHTPYFYFFQVFLIAPYKD